MCGRIRIYVANFKINFADFTAIFKIFTPDIRKRTKFATKTVTTEKDLKKKREKPHFITFYP